MFTVHHLGRTGAVAGGMTQVLNDYMSWEFPTTEQRVIASRGSSHLQSARKFIRAWREISRLNAGQDVLAGHVSQGGSFLREGGLMVRAARLGIPVVAHIHGSSFPRFARAHPRLAGWALRRARVVVVLSDETRNAVEQLGVAAEIRVIPNAVAEAPPTEKENLAVFGGSVNRRKGVDTLVSAWLSAEVPDWTLVIAGPVLEPDLVLGLDSTCAVVGPLPRQELLQLLGRASIAVLPSTEEAMPLFILEAMSAGAAIVSTPVGAVPSVIGDGHGVIVPVGDTDALSQALTLLVTDGERRRAMGSAGRERWRAVYSPDAVMSQLEDAWSRARGGVE